MWSWEEDHACVRKCLVQEQEAGDGPDLPQPPGTRPAHTRVLAASRRRELILLLKPLSLRSFVTTALRHEHR